MFSLSLSRTLAGALLLSGAAATQAATLLVTVKADAYDGVCNLHCSLRDAVAVANQSGGANTILLPSGTYVLTRPLELDANAVPIDDDDHQIGDLDVVGELRIRGLGATKTRIQGQFNDRLFEVRPGASLTLEKLTLEKGATAHNGGAVENHGQLTLHELLVQDNQASTYNPNRVPIPVEEAFSYGQGGGIANYGELTVRSSRLQNNFARGGDQFVRLDRNTGRGGAIFNSAGSVLLLDSVLHRNAAVDLGDTGAGAALYNLEGSVTVERSTIIEHDGREFASSAIINHDGELILSNSTLTRNGKGALLNSRSQASAPAQATLTNVTIAGNVFDEGVAVVNSGDLLIRNSIIAGNYGHIPERAVNCVNVGDSYSYQAVGLLLNDEPSNCSADYVVPFDATFSTVLKFTPTQHNATIWTLDLLPGSPAIDAGIGDCIDQDQRGIARPQDGNGDGVALCDLGAFEVTAQ